MIFSDGTGQAGGLTPDENVSNICKLYRATRCGPEFDIDPKEQLMLFGLLADLSTARLPVSEATFSANGVGA